MDNPRILIVDDMEDIRKLYRSILAKKDTYSDLETAANALFSEDEVDDGFLEIDENLFEETGEATLINDESDFDHYELIEVSQGLEAVKVVEDSQTEAQPICLIFLDMRMPPAIDGLETAKRIRAIDPYVEIVIMTAYSDYSLEEIKEELGNPDRLLYFQKPFQPSQIKHLASSLCQKWYLEQKTREQESIHHKI
jgi:diguanylate cyclase